MIELSVIIPFFNAERTIVRCAKSLFSQDKRDGIEFIFVDDGSTDGSVEALKSTISDFPDLHGNIRIIQNDVNTGSACSRERGTAAARGEFVIHCDADDWVDADIYSTLLYEAGKNDADIACCSFVSEYPGKSKAEYINPDKFPGLTELPLDTLHFSLCNKIVRRSLITDNDLHFFPGINCWEDLGMMTRVFAMTDKITVTNRPLYHYKRHPKQSQTTTDMGKVLADHLKMAEALESWYENCKCKTPELEFLIEHIKFESKIKMLRGGNRDPRRWKSTFPESNKLMMSYPGIPLYYKIAFLLCDKLPLWLTTAAARLANRISR